MRGGSHDGSGAVIRSHRASNLSTYGSFNFSSDRNDLSCWPEPGRENLLRILVRLWAACPFFFLRSKLRLY
jgi:hypothetical protein